MRTEYDGLHSRIETSETQINKDLFYKEYKEYTSVSIQERAQEYIKSCSNPLD